MRKSIELNPIQARRHIVPPVASPKSRHIFKTAWGLEFLLCDFSFYKFSIQKSLVPPISHHVCCHGSHTTFRLIFKTQIFSVFQVIPPERNHLWNNLLCFGHHYTLRSLIEGNIRSVTVERLQKTFCSNMVIDTKQTV